MASRLPKRALLKVGYRCNNNCVFCHSAPHRGHEASTIALKEKIARAWNLGAEMIVLSGGEPTIRRDLLSLAARVAEKGMSLGLVTNARMLSYPDLLSRLLKNKLRYAQVSVCGPNAKSHNRHTRSTSFEQTMQGLRRLSGLVEEVVINVVVTRWNLPLLGDMPKIADGLTGAAMKFSLVEPEGNALEIFDRLVPPLQKAAWHINQILLSEAGRDVRFDGLPLCLVPPRLWERESSLREEGFFLVSEAFEDEWYPVDENHRTHPRRCSACSLRRRCRGVFRLYLEKRGADELKPLDRPVPNSFRLEPTGRTMESFAPACPVKSGLCRGTDPTRGIFVQQGRGSVKEYCFQGRDFSDATLTLSIRNLEQLYLWTRGPHAGKNLAKELRRLALERACKSCPTRPLCGGLWRPSGSGFSAFNQRLSRVLQRLRGSVLDIGCGAAEYLKWLSPGLAKGKLTYLGLDPKIAPSHLPAGARFLKVSFQDYICQSVFDNLLVIRSLNHLGCPEAALQKMFTLAAKEARLFLADDVVFGVVDPAAEPVGRCRLRRGPEPAFEHRTNLLPEEAEEICLSAGWKPVRRSPASPGCPAWWLECHRFP